MFSLMKALRCSIDNRPLEIKPISYLFHYKCLLFGWIRKPGGKHERAFQFNMQLLFYTYQSKGKENIKALRLLSKTSTLHIHRTFWVHFFFISRFMEDVYTRRQIFLFLKLANSSLQFDCRRIRLQFSEYWKNRDEVWENGLEFTLYVMFSLPSPSWYLLVFFGKLLFNFQTLWGGGGWALAPPAPPPATGLFTIKSVIVKFGTIVDCNFEINSYCKIVSGF